MKFLIIAPRFHTNLYYRVKALKDAGHTIKVVVLYKGKSEFYENINIQQIRLSLTSKLFLKTISLFKKNNLKSSLELRLQSPGKELKQIIKTYKPNVIILKAYQNMFALKTLFIAKKYKLKVLMLTQTPHTHIKNSKLLFKLNIKLFKYLKVFAYITPIKSNFEAFKSYGIQNVYYLPFVYPIIEKEIKKREKDIPLKIISVGKYVKRKDQRILINATKDFLKRKKATIDFYGEIADIKYYNELKLLIKENNLESAITLFNNINYKELQDKYKEYDIFVLPSYSEPAAFSIVEAMANSLPVVCSDQNGTKCYIEEGKNGYVFKAKNLKSLKKTMSEIIADQFSETISTENFNTFKKEHTTKQFVESIINICK